MNQTYHQKLLSKAQTLFESCQHPISGTLRVSGNKLLQLTKSVSPYTTYGITVSLLEVLPSGTVSPEFAVTLDGRHLQVLIDPFGLTPDHKEFNLNPDSALVFLDRLLTKAQNKGEVFLHGHPAAGTREGQSHTKGVAA